MVAVIRTDDEPAASRMGYWRDVVCDRFVSLDMEIDRPAEHRAQLVHSDLGSTHLAEITTTSTLVRRTPRHVRRAAPELYKLELQTCGTSVLSQDEREAVLEPGDLTIVDQTRPYHLAAGFSPRGASPRAAGWAHQALNLTLPRALLPLSTDEMARLTSVRFSSRDPVTRLVTPVLRHLMRCCVEYDPAIALRLSSVVVDLLGTGLADRLGRGRAVAPESHRRALMLRIRGFVDQHSGDADLCPATIAAAHHISVRYLQKLFEAEATTVTEHIRRRRLERARRELVDPASAARPVASVAMRCGFGSVEHFTRLFRAAHGVPPGEYRRRHFAEAV